MKGDEGRGRGRKGANMHPSIRWPVVHPAGWLADWLAGNVATFGQFQAILQSKRSYFD